MLLTVGPLAAQWPTEQGVSSVDRIVLLPLTDGRAAQKPKVNLEKLRKQAQKDLKRKGYVVVLSGDAKGEPWSLAITLDEISVQGMSPAARVSGKLYDSASRVLWTYTGFGRYHSANEQPSPAGATMGDQMQLATAGMLTDLLFLSTGSARGYALDNAVFDLVKAVPSRISPKQKKTKAGTK